MLITLLIVFFLTSCVFTYNLRLKQHLKKGTIPQDTPIFSAGFQQVLTLVDWAILIWITVIDWRIGIASFVIRVILMSLGVLEFVGAFLSYPLLKSKIPKDPFA